MGKADTLGSVVERVERTALVWSKRVRQRLAPVPPPHLTVLVAGMQRSGTNMLMEVLERSLATDVYHERDPRAFDHYQMRPVPVIHRLRARSGASHFVIKALCELQRMRELLTELAPARGLFVLRRYQDVANSMVVSFENIAYQVRRLAAEPDYHPWLGQGMSAETQAILARLAHDGISERTAAALEWYLRNVLYFEQGLDREPDVLLVPYEPLVTRPHEELKRVFDFIGLEYTKRVGAKVSPRSIRRRPPPDLDPEVDALCEGLTARFAALLP